MPSMPYQSPDLTDIPSLTMVIEYMEYIMYLLFNIYIHDIDFRYT